jgi:hypothetical protein
MGVKGTNDTYTQLQTYMMDRLKGLLALHEQCKRDPGSEPWKLKMVNWGIYSALRDCEEQGVGAEAELLLHRGQ